MDKRCLLEMLGDGPIIASVKNEAGLAAALLSRVRVIFLLYGDVLTIGTLTDRVHAAGKAVFVHLDLIEGLAPREVAVDFIAERTCADGIISTKPQLVRRARELSLVAIRRFFLLDSMAVETMRKQLDQDSCDLVEVLPGVMPKILRQLTSTLRKPVIAGGLICDKEDVTGALSAGAVAVSSTGENVWFL